MNLEHVPVDLEHVLVNLQHVQRLKLIGNISVASVRRPVKLGKNRSSCAGDIKDFSKSKMAAVPPFWIEFKD